MHRLSIALAVGLCTVSLPAQPAGFQTYAGIVATMQAAANNFPAICQFVDLNAKYGTPLTVNGNRIYAIRISDNVAVEEDEPSFLMVSAHHGNEYGTPVVALDAISRLTSGYGVDPTITQLVDENEIWIAPVWNPDGYWTSRNNANGVDLNRNYPFLWSSPCNTGLAGPSAASENETQLMVAFSEDQRFAKVLDYHSSGREVLYGYRQACGQNVFGNYLAAEAALLSAASSYGGAIREPSSNGEHYEWQLGVYSNYAFLTEISNTQSPTIASALQEADDVWPGTVWMLQRAIPVWGHVTDAVTGLPLVASISYVENPFTLGEQNRSEPLFGRYHAFLPAGTHTIRFELAGYQPQEVPVTVVAGSSLLVDVALAPPGLSFSYPNGLPTTVDPAGGTTIRVDVAASLENPQPGTGRVSLQSANGAQTISMTELSPNMYEAELPGFVCNDTVQLTFAADDTNGQEWQAVLVQIPTAIQVNVNSSNAFEVPSGWTGGVAGDTAIRGIWNRMDPVATAAQPGDDHTPTGTDCWVTDGNGGSLGAFDVDGGFTTLLSPTLDLSALTNPGIRYWRWFSNNQNGIVDDEFQVDISGDNGANWIRAETVGPAGSGTTGGWLQHSFVVSDFIAPSAQVRVRFVARDEGTGSIVEAAVDDFEIFEVVCDGEVVRSGNGCPDGTGATLRLFQTGGVHIGATTGFGIEAGSAQPVFLFAGFDDAMWAGLPLPVVLPGTGVPGCEVSVQPDVLLGLMPLNGTLPVVMPASPSVIGESLFWQALMLDPTLTTPLQFATSDRLVTTLGS